MPVYLMKQYQLTQNVAESKMKQEIIRNRTILQATNYTWIRTTARYDGLMINRQVIYWIQRQTLAPGIGVVPVTGAPGLLTHVTGSVLTDVAMFSTG